MSALVAPLFNLTGTVTNTLTATESALGLCAYIETLNTSLVGLDTCAAGTGIPISIPNLAGFGQSIARTVNLSSLSSLPLIPQVGSTGAFTNPVYGAGLVPSSYGTDASPTALTMVQGSVSTDATLLTTLAGLVSGTGAVPNSYIDTNAIKSALRTSLGVVNTGTTNLGDEVWDTLSTTDQNTIVGALTASVVPMGTIGSCVSSTASCLVGVTGTYESFPVLNVSVPSGTATGNFEGTLVVTGF